MLIGRFLHKDYIRFGIIEAPEIHLIDEDIFNKITERHIGSTGLINHDIWKSCDTFGPCGPWISTNLNHDNSVIRTYLNKEIVQEDNTGKTLFSVKQILSFLSSFMTLYPGDLIVTGTPAGIGPVQ